MHFPRRCYLAILITSLASTLSLSAHEIKIMTVDINKLFTHYHVSKKETATFKAEQQAYQKEREERQKSIDEVAEKIKTILTKLRTKAMPEVEKQNLTEEAQELISQFRALNKDSKESDQDKLNETREKIALARRKGLDHIAKIVAQYAKDNGYQWVIETSGLSNTQISPLVYARNAEDKTDQILTILNKDAPQEEQPK